MNSFIKQFDSLNEDEPITDEELYDLFNHIASFSTKGTVENFAKENIILEDAQNIVFSQDDVIEDYLEFALYFNPSTIMPVIKHNPKDLAYLLAMEEPQTATELFEELTYYRDQGRV